MKLAGFASFEARCAGASDEETLGRRLSSRRGLSMGEWVQATLEDPP